MTEVLIPPFVQALLFWIDATGDGVSNPITVVNPEVHSRGCAGVELNPCLSKFDCPPCERLNVNQPPDLVRFSVPVVILIIDLLFPSREASSTMLGDLLLVLVVVAFVTFLDQLLAQDRPFDKLALNSSGDRWRVLVVAQRYALKASDSTFDDAFYESKNAWEDSDAELLYHEWSMLDINPSKCNIRLHNSACFDAISWQC